MWDSDDVETVSETATFETGLMSEADKSDVNWLSYAEASSEETVYTIDFDFIIDSCNQGFCFGMQNSGTFVMWQVNTYAENGKVLLRPHFKKNGEWTAYPGGPGSVSATDITSAVKGNSANVIGKLVHERIEVNGKNIKMYFSADESSLALVNEYTHTESIPLGNIGFRHCSENNEREVARYDNIVVKNADGVVYLNDFSSQETGFTGGDWGGTGWADAGIIVPYNLYMLYGDKTVIEENWDSMNSYMNYLSKTNKFGGRPVWGDWLAYESNDDKVREILGVAFYAWDALLMAEMAEATGRLEQADEFLNIYQQEKDFFMSRYMKSDGTLVRGEQTICLYALYLDLLPDEDSVAAVTEQLVSNIQRNGNRLQTGFLGTAIIMDTLTKIGRSDIAYTLLLQHDNPSWLYSVDQGATTVWERWNSYTVESGFGDVVMNSFNHYAYGAVASWMFKSMAGIGYDSGAPGFQNLIIAPQPDERIAEVKASYDCAYGTVMAESVIKDGKWTYKITLPANTSAEIRLPVSDVKVNGKERNQLKTDADGITYRKKENGVLIFKAVSGTFEFTSQI